MQSAPPLLFFCILCNLNKTEYENYANIRLQIVYKRKEKPKMIQKKHGCYKKIHYLCEKFRNVNLRSRKK